MQSQDKCNFRYVCEFHQKVNYLSSVLSDTSPQRFEDTIKGLDTIRGCSFGQSSESQSSDGSHFLLFIHKSCNEQSQIVQIFSDTTDVLLHENNCVVLQWRSKDRESRATHHVR